MTEPWVDAWAAGVIDSDGCITIKRRSRGAYYALVVVVAQAGDDDPPVIRRLLETYGGSLEHRDRAGRQRMWHWTIATKQAETTLRRVRPFLVGKADQADLALEYRATVGEPGRRQAPGVAERYYWRLRAMHYYQGGTPLKDEEDA
jgi:hypothetical protein